MSQTLYYRCLCSLLKSIWFHITPVLEGRRSRRLAMLYKERDLCPSHARLLMGSFSFLPSFQVSRKTVLTCPVVVQVLPLTQSLTGCFSSQEPFFGWLCKVHVLCVPLLWVSGDSYHASFSGSSCFVVLMT